MWYQIFLIQWKRKEWEWRDKGTKKWQKGDQKSSIVQRNSQPKKKHFGLTASPLHLPTIGDRGENCEDIYFKEFIRTPCVTVGFQPSKFQFLLKKISNPWVSLIVFTTKFVLQPQHRILRYVLLSLYQILMAQFCCLAIETETFQL